jgi:hypothetical protein
VIRPLENQCVSSRSASQPPLPAPSSSPLALNSVRTPPGTSTSCQGGWTATRAPGSSRRSRVVRGLNLKAKKREENLDLKAGNQISGFKVSKFVVQEFHGSRYRVT